MIIQHLFSSPKGDIILSPEDLARPFLITPTENHPFLTLGDYFKAVEIFILDMGSKTLLSILSKRLNRKTNLEDIQELAIRSEKHGTLYHPASVEMQVHNQQFKLAVSTAVTEQGKAWLTHEYDTLNNLNTTTLLPYLPEVYFKSEVRYRTECNKHETLVMLLAQWLDGYHEWHFAADEKDKSQKICIWDLTNGYHLASEKEAFEIFRQASKILTLYYDTQHFNQIYPWHHAAGDFVVKTGEKGVDVKLTTARKHESIMAFFSSEKVDPMIAMVYFFLNLTIRMRLDKLDGVGEAVWAGDFSVDAAVRGFFEALHRMKMEGRYGLGTIEQLCTLLQAFDVTELEGLFQSLIALYQDDDPADLRIIQENLKDHVRFLYQCLQNIR